MEGLVKKGKQLKVGRIKWGLFKVNTLNLSGK
jgi:hypothetical protein